MEPIGLEPTTFWLQTRQTFRDIGVFGMKNADITGTPVGGCTGCCTGPAQPISAYPDLVPVVEFWASLPSHIRQAILTLVESAAPKPGTGE